MSNGHGHGHGPWGDSNRTPLLEALKCSGTSREAGEPYVACASTSFYQNIFFIEPGADAALSFFAPNKNKVSYLRALYISLYKMHGIAQLYFRGSILL